MNKRSSEQSNFTTEHNFRDEVAANSQNSCIKVKNNNPLKICKCVFILYFDSTQTKKLEFIFSQVKNYKKQGELPSDRHDRQDLKHF